MSAKHQYFRMCLEPCTQFIIDKIGYKTYFHDGPKLSILFVYKPFVNFIKKLRKYSRYSKNMCQVRGSCRLKCKHNRTCKINKRPSVVSFSH